MSYPRLKERIARFCNELGSFRFEMKAMSYTIRGKHNLALVQYQNAAEIRPKDSNAWMGIGDCQLALGNITKAQEAYEKMAECDNHNWRARTKLAEVQAASGNLEEAAMSYRRVFADLGPGDRAIAREWVLCNLGDTLLQLGNVTDAIGAFEKAIATSPKRAHVYERVASALLRASAIEAAERFCRLGLKRVWSQTYLRCVLADILNHAQKYDEALTILEPLRPWYSRSTKRYHAEQMIVALSRLKDFEAVVAFARKTIRRRIASRYVLQMLGWAHHELDDIEATIDAHEIAVLSGTKDVAAYIELISLYVQRGQFASARLACERLRSIRERAAGIMLEYIESAE